MEIFKTIGSSFSYILSAIALVVLIVNSIKGKLGIFVKKETKSDTQNQRLENLENLLADYIKKEEDFREQVLEMLHIQKKASRQSLAHIIEETYYKNKDAKQLDRIELKRVINAYDIYHNRCEGNSYITEIYEEMMDWDRL